MRMPLRSRPPAEVGPGMIADSKACIIKYVSLESITMIRPDATSMGILSHSRLIRISASLKAWGRSVKVSPAVSNAAKEKL
jgi:hypothetical protein